MILTLLAAALLGLSDAHAGQLIELLADTLKATKEGLQAIWIALSPFMMAYLAYRQARNKRTLSEELRENTAVNKEALDKANGHNEKIAKVVEVQQTMANTLNRTTQPSETP